MAHVTRPILAAAVAKVAALDLTTVTAFCEFHYQWDTDRAQAAELNYRRYLTLIALGPDVTLNPSFDIDQYWHAHILHTKKYFADCQYCLDTFLHHTPEVPGGNFDPVAFWQSFDDTAALFDRFFGVRLEPGVERDTGHPSPSVAAAGGLTPVRCEESGAAA